MKISDSVTVITGAARGIGLALTEALTAEGGRVVMLDRDADLLSAAASRLPRHQVITQIADVRVRSELDEAAGLALSHFGGLDAWINNAGLARHKPVLEYSGEDLDLMMDVNLKGAVLGCQAALAAMAPRGRGRIVNLISTAALRGIPTESFYCATKWGLRGFTQALAEEAAPLGIAVSALLPGGVDTAFWNDAVDREMPVADFLTPAQVADAALGILRQDENCVTRELVVRSLADRDFAGR
jgi:NAD(P)-dependent dehydrogenase (short-subunit alcohol dehydrogenase family)